MKYFKYKQTFEKIIKKSILKSWLVFLIKCELKFIKYQVQNYELLKKT